MRKFGVLLKKELRELLTPQMLVPFLITVLMFAAIGGIVGDQGNGAEQTSTVGVVDLDNSAASSAVLEAVEQAGFAIEAIDATDGEQLAEELRARDVQLGLIVPDGFEADASSGNPASIETYALVKGFSLVAAQGSERLAAVLRAINDALSDQLLAQAAPGADPTALKQPVSFSEHVVLGDESAAVSVDQVFGFVLEQTTFIPIVLFIVIIFAAQMIATTIASEKENKTLETLLASPVSRASLITAKMVAAAIVALLSAGAYMLGMRYYMEGVTSGMGGGGGDATAGFVDALNLAMSPTDWLLLGATLFVSILVALAIAVILGAFAENVKAVQSLLTPLMIMVMVPYLLTLFVDLDAAGGVLKWTVMAIPFSHSFSAAPRLFLNDYGAVIAGIAYQLIWFAALVVVAARIFSSDRILTMKLDLRRKKR